VNQNNQTNEATITSNSDKKTTSNSDKLHINMLGNVSLTYNGKSITDQNVRSKKFWQIVEYLITFRNRDVSQTELIDLIYPEGKSDNPANALKTTIHRVRGELIELGHENAQNMIVQRRGAYAWNSNIECVIDAEEFEKLCRAAASADAEEKSLENYLHAIELYKGDFLHKSALEPWAVQLNIYYHTLFSDAVHKTIALLKKNHDWHRMIEVCEKALNIDAFDEDLYYNMILALINTENHSLALEEYRKMTTLFYREFGVTPSKETMKLYREILKPNSKEVEMDLSIIKENLKEEEPGRGPFFCEYEIFKDFYRIEVRISARTGESVYLALLTLVSEDGGVPKVKQLNKYMDRLRDSINKTLRSGDIFAQYSVCQFILLLPLTTYENGEMIMDRVVKRFGKVQSTDNFTLIHSLQAIETPTAQLT